MSPPSTGPRTGELNRELRRLMQSVGLTDRSLAAELEVHPSTFSSWMTGRGRWPPSELYTVCARVGMNPWTAGEMLGLLPGDADLMLTQLRAAASQPALVSLGLDSQTRDPVADVIGAVRAAGFDAAVLAHHRGINHRRWVHSLVVVLERGDARDPADPQWIRDRVSQHLAERGVTDGWWEEAPELIPSAWRGHPVLIVEDVFRPTPPSGAATPVHGPIYIGGVYYSGAKNLPHLLHDRLGIGAIDVSAPFGARLQHRDSSNRQGFLQETIATELLRFPPTDALAVTADDFGVMIASLQRLEAGQWRPQGTFVMLLPTEPMLDYAAFHCARTAAASETTTPETTAVDWWRATLERAQRDLLDVARRLFGSRCLEVEVALPASVTREADGGWPNAVDAMFDGEVVNAERVADQLRTPGQPTHG